MLHQPLVSAPAAAMNTSATHTTSCGRGAGAAAGERDWGDGPAFRANISQLEAKTSTLKQSVKRILKTATACLQAQQALLRADQQFITALRETPCTEPLFTHYLDSAWNDIHNERERLNNSMQTLLIDPLQKLYDCDIKQAEHKRRQFEEESKKYYASLSKYLGGKKNETKYLAKKSRYDMIRFDYHTFLTDLHRGKKEMELLYHLFSLQERQHAYYTTTAHDLERQKTGLEHIAGLIADASREQAIVNKERSSTRKALQAAVDHVAIQKKQQHGGVSPASAASSPSTLKEENKGKFHGIRDLQSPGNRASAGRRKEGVLFATSRPLKVNGSDRPAHGVTWHKYWCILRTGQLCEYSNWKRSPAAHREPLNLRFATVRVARNTDRKFCFEVITPQFRRLYQAMSQEDMDDWVSTINNAIESVLNGAGSTADINYQDSTIPRRNSIGGAFVGHITSEAKRKFYRHSIGPVKRASSGFMDMNFAELLPGSLYLPATFSNKGSESTTDSSLPSVPSLATSAAAFPPPAPPMIDDGTKASSVVTTATTTAFAKKEGTIPRLLQRLYEADVSNTKCADCGSENPEWCSLNLGILLCIECSGIHRSLGSHLSKVRSLMLDSTSYTPEVVDILLALGNARSNAIWDPRISTASSDNNYNIPSSNSPRRDKVDYIFAKYRERTYVRPPPRPSNNNNNNPQMLLLEAIENNDLVLASHSFALGADPNVPHTASTLTLFTNSKNNNGDYDGYSDDNSSHEPKYISLPVLDADGEQVPDKFLTFPVPEPFAVRYPLHFSLLKRQQEDTTNKQLPDFVMAEFLFQNGADAFIVDPYNGYPLSELVGIGYAVDDNALMYFNQKITARGARRVWRTSINSPPCKKA